MFSTAMKLHGERTGDAELLHVGVRLSLHVQRDKGLLRSLGSAAKASPGFPMTTPVHVCGSSTLGLHFLICVFVSGRTWPQELLSGRPIFMSCRVLMNKGCQPRVSRPETNSCSEMGFVGYSVSCG